MKMLLEECRESLRLTERMRKEAPEEDQKIYGNMVGSLEFTKKWLETGQMPVRVHGLVPSDALSGMDEDLSHLYPDEYSRSAFEKADDRIDAEIRRRKRA